MHSNLDDTILVAFGSAQSQRQRTIAAFADQLGLIEATIIAAAIHAASTELWCDPAWHKYSRHRTGAVRRRIVATAKDSDQTDLDTSRMRDERRHPVGAGLGRAVAALMGARWHFLL